MTIALNDTSITASKTYSGSGSYEVAAGKSLKIETSPNGDDILDVTVPDGKSWKVKIYVKITETSL